MDWPRWPAVCYIGTSISLPLGLHFLDTITHLLHPSLSSINIDKWGILVLQKLMDETAITIPQQRTQPENYRWVWHCYLPWTLNIKKNICYVCAKMMVSKALSFLCELSFPEKALLISLLSGDETSAKQERPGWFEEKKSCHEHMPKIFLPVTSKNVNKV